MTIITAEARRLREALTSATDTALTRVVSMLEEAGKPDEVDTLLEAVRGRLRNIRPPRRLQLSRLLFLPLDGSIVAAPDWQRGSSQLPRNVLACMAAHLRAAAPAEWDALAQAARGHGMDDMEAVGRLGRPLWALAARAMPTQAPSNWQSETGLKPEHYPALARICLAVWREASPLWDAVENVAELPLPMLHRALAPMLSDAELFSICLTTLMHHSPTPWVVAASAGSMGAMPRMVADRALDTFIETVMPEIDPEMPGLSAQRAQHFVDIWLALETSTPDGRPERRRRMQQIRNDTDRACRAAFAQALERQFTTPLARLVSAASDAEILAIEDRARQIRRLGLAGRRIGSGTAYDEMERGIPAAMAQLLAQLPAQPLAQPPGQATPGGLTNIDLARLAEIMCGPEAAAKLL